MGREFTQDEADRHNALVARGWAITEGRLLLHGQAPPGPPGWYTRWQLRRALWFFEQALNIDPENWSSMWAVGKIHQRLGDQDTAFDWFLRAHRLNPGQADVLREAGLAALDTRHTPVGIELCEAAVAQAPDDPGLVSNLALAYCLGGRDGDAQRCAAEAARRDPADAISATVLAFVGAVASGKRPRPVRLAEAFPAE
jgi:tetratricopeptide (TPR) repeat protein